MPPAITKLLERVAAENTPPVQKDKSGDVILRASKSNKLDPKTVTKSKIQNLKFY